MWLFKKKSKEIKSVLFQTRNVWIKDVLFVIKKIDVQSYLAGYKAVQKSVDIYDNKKANEANFDKVNFDKELEHLKALRDHYQEVIGAGCVSPKFTKNKEVDTVQFDELFLDWDLATKLYQEIVNFTNNQKKK